MTDTASIPEGYKSLRGSHPAEEHIGPFYYRREGEGIRLGFRAAAHHCNAINSVHGGVLLAFGDYCVTMLGLTGVKENCATVSFSSDFVAAALLGDWIEGEGEVTHRSGSMTFVTGRLRVGDQVVLTFQSVLRRLKKN